MQGGLNADTDARRLAEERDRECGQRHLPRSQAALRISSASTSTASRSGASSGGSTREKEGPPLKKRLSEQRVHQVARPALPAGGRDDGAGRHHLHHRHVSRHHPGREFRRAGKLPARSAWLQYDLDKIIHKGRIWRLVFDGVKPDRSMRCGALASSRGCTTRPRRSSSGISHHPNGWWRDTAQQLLVLEQDKSVVPALQLMARSSKNLLARFHAMWTLEGPARSSPRWCGSSWKIRSRGCASRRFARARRSSKPAIALRRGLHTIDEGFER